MNPFQHVTTCTSLTGGGKHIAPLMAGSLLAAAVTWRQWNVCVKSWELILGRSYTWKQKKKKGKKKKQKKKRKHTSSLKGIHRSK